MHRSQGDRPPIGGMAAPAFRAVYQEFQRNFIERDEKGAACAVYYQGEKVVDLWGGYRCPTTGAPWTEQTLVLVFSITKGVAAAVMALAHRAVSGMRRPFGLCELSSEAPWPS